MYMLISIWGSGGPKYSAMKFVLFTLFGGALMLVGILSIYMSTDVGTLIGINSRAKPSRNSRVNSIF